MGHLRLSKKDGLGVFKMNYKKKMNRINNNLKIQNSKNSFVFKYKAEFQSSVRGTTNIYQTNKPLNKNIYRN